MKKRVQTFIQFLTFNTGDYARDPSPCIPVQNREKPSKIPSGAYAYRFFDRITITLEHEGEVLRHVFDRVNSRRYFVTGTLMSIPEAKQIGDDFDRHLLDIIAKKFTHIVVIYTHNSNISRNGGWCINPQPFNPTTDAMDVREPAPAHS